MLSIHESSLQIGKIHDWLNESYPRKWIQTITVLPILNEDSCITKKLFNNNNNKLVNINRGAKKCLIIVSVCNVRGDTWHRSWSRSWHCSSNQFHRWHRLHCQLKHIILINDSDKNKWATLSIETIKIGRRNFRNCIRMVYGFADL